MNHYKKSKKHTGLIMRQTIVLLFTLALVFSPFSSLTNVYAAVEDDYEWDDNGDRTVTITDYTGSDTDLTIPNELDGRSVVEIGDNAFQSKGLTSVTIPDSVKRIRNYAFGDNSFTSFTIPSNVEVLGDAPFSSSSLEEIIVENNPYYKDINRKGLYTTDGETIIMGTKSGEIADGVKFIGNYALSGYNFTEIDIPNSVEKIGSFTFRYNDLTSIDIPENVSEIQLGAFRLNGGLADVTIRNPQTTFNGAVFTQNQSNPMDLTIHGYTSSTAEDYALDNNHTFKFIHEGDYEWDDNGDGTVTITDYTGSDTDLTIPEQLDGKNVSIIGYEAFSYKNLESVVIPDDVVKIGEFAFGGNSLTSVEIPDSVTEIEEAAFHDNYLQNVELPDNLIKIGEEAFSINSLESIVIPNNVPKIGEFAFSNNDLTSAEIPDSVTEIGEGAFAFNNLSSVEIPDGITKIDIGVFHDNNLTSVDIPDSVTIIESGAFAFNELTSIEIPENVTKILGGVADGAFENNQLENVVIPDSVTEIGTRVFADNHLTEASVYNKDTVFGSEVFEDNQTDPEDLTMFGHDPSTAKVYAQDNSHTFQVISANKDELDDLVNDAKTYDGDKYTGGSFEALEDAIAQAEDVLADDNATQDEVDDAFAYLEEAINSLKINITVTKEWVGTSQDSVTVHLLLDGDRFEEAILNEENDWTHTFENVLAGRDGEPMDYSIEEEQIDGYETEISGNPEDGFVVTNTEITGKGPKGDPCESQDSKAAGCSEGEDREDHDEDPDEDPKEQSEEDLEEETEGDKLPKTSTNMFNIILIGGLLLTMGMVLIAIRRRMTAK